MQPTLGISVVQFPVMERVLVAVPGVMKVTGHARNLGKSHARYTEWEATLVFLFGRRWLRFGAFWGAPPGSHIGFWRTRVDNLRGLNLRVGKRCVGPCFTVLAHTRQRDVGNGA